MITFHSHSWQCPHCHKWRRVRYVYGDIRLARCCGHKFVIKTKTVEVVRQDTVIYTVIQEK